MQDAETKQQTWPGIAANWCALWAEASLVVPLRLARLARGGDAAAEELRLMIDEKVEAHGDFLIALSAGALGRSPRGWIGGSLSVFLPYVRANRRRLLGQDSS